MEEIKALVLEHKKALAFLSKGRRGNFIDGQELQPSSGSSM
jgi:hypothetical protein